MTLRELGLTGLQVPVLGFGGSPLGRVFGAVEESDGIRAVHAAVERGVNLFDVSPFYGLTLAETVLGQALKSVARERFLVSTKMGRYGANEFDFSADRVARSLDESLRRLNVEYVDLLFAHDVEYADLNQIVEETLPALYRHRDQGKARFIGISGLPLSVFRTVLECAPLDVILSYCHYTLFDTSLESLLPLLAETGVGVINAAPLAMGLLTDGGPPPWHPASPEIKDACARAAAHCRERGADIAQLAIQFAVANPAVDTTLVGIGSVEALDRNLAAVKSPMDQQVLAEVQGILAPIHNRTWPSGRRENDGE